MTYGMQNYPLIVIGAGAGGLVVAIGFAKAGKKVLLIDKGTWGGDCTNFGCIPSKATIASAESAHNLLDAPRLGVQASVGQFSSEQVLPRVRSIIQQIREEEEPTALQAKGVDTLEGTAHFIDSHTLEVVSKETPTRVKGNRIVIATGSHPFIPSLPGLDAVPYCTNETIFDLDQLPRHLAVLGGGPIGSELAQAFRRLGSEVTILQHGPHLLAKEEPESQQLIEERFSKEGIHLLLSHETRALERAGDEIRITVTDKKTGLDHVLQASHLLISAGRRPSVDRLHLERAGVTFSKRGVEVDKFGRTTQKHIFAIGDCTGAPPFTHLAENHGRQVLQNLLLPRLLWKKCTPREAIPRVTFTDPEIAATGLTEKQAIELYGTRSVKSYLYHFSELDRAITAGREDGFVKVVTKKWSSKILGATIVGARAGEMIMELQLAMVEKIPLRKLSQIIHPYPTYSLAVRKVADQWLSQTLLPLFKR